MKNSAADVTETPVAALFVTASFVSSHAQAPYDVKANYVKREVSIPMRDGVKLFTIIYTPKAVGADPRLGPKYPMLMTRTAYGIGPYGPDAYRTVLGPNNDFAKEGYIFVYQDTRGKFKSEGEFIHHVPIVKGSPAPNESTDTWDTIDWLVKNVPNNNGRVGQYGISWAGWEVSMGMIDAHPALKASSPQAPPQDQFFGDDYHSGGAYQMMYGFNWMSTNARARVAPNERDNERFDYGTPDGYRFFLEMGSAANALKYFADDVPTYKDHMAHGTYDEYWQARNVPKDLVNINHPVLIVAAWFDAQDFYGPFRMYRALKEKNPSNKTTLAVGPWLHGGWARSDGDTLGQISFGSKTAAYYRANIELPFFNYYLKDKGRLNLAEAVVFETGGNKWHSYPQWPPAGARARNLYLQAGGKLGFGAPADRSDEAFDDYVEFDDVADRLRLMVTDLSSDAGQVTSARHGSFGTLTAEVATPLAMALTEVLQNAVQHGIAGRAGVVTVTAHRSEGRLLVTVDDDGSGLPPGFDVAGSASLGLSIVRTLVESELDGRLVVARRSAGGTRVTLDVPAAG